MLFYYCWDRVENCCFFVCVNSNRYLIVCNMYFRHTSSNSADQLRSLGPKSDYDKNQKTEVSMFSFYVDSWYAALNRGVRTNLAKSQSLECASRVC